MTQLFGFKCLEVNLEVVKCNAFTQILDLFSDEEKTEEEIVTESDIELNRIYLQLKVLQVFFSNVATLSIVDVP